MKNIWIMNHYATSMYFQQAGRHYSFAKEFKKRGYSPTIFAAASEHKASLTSLTESDPIQIGYKLYTEKQSAHEFPFVFVNTNNYGGNGLSRIVNMLLFSINLFITALLYSRKHPKPDLIYASSAHPFTCVTGLILARIFSVKCVCEVRDLWPLSFVELGITPKEHIAVRLLYGLEKWIYTKADRLIFTMEGGAEYIRDQKWDTMHGGTVNLSKVFHINNGVDLELFDYNRENCKIDDKDLKDDSYFKIVYTGTMGIPNNVISLLDIAEQLKDKKIKFLLWGKGSEVNKITNAITEKELSNVIYKGSVEKKFIPYILSKADANIFIIMDTPLYRYGMSLNKSFDYLASGKPLLVCGKTNYSLVKKHLCGLELSSSKEINCSNIICNLISDKQKLNILAHNARKVSQEYDFKNLTLKLETVLTFE